MTSAHDLFLRARKVADRPNHAPTVAGIIVRDMRKEITANPEMHEFLLMHGALPNVESWMKRRRRPTAESKTEPPEAQLSLWPKHVRPIVEAIDRDALYVPSLDEYVPLQVDQISKEQLREAGAWLLSHAEDTRRVAILVNRLADEL